MLYVRKLRAKCWLEIGYECFINTPLGKADVKEVKELFALKGNTGIKSNRYKLTTNTFRLEMRRRFLTMRFCISPHSCEKTCLKTFGFCQRRETE